MKYTLYIFFVFITFFSLPKTGFSQNDTIKTVPKKNNKQIYSAARKATVMSAVLPGLGQIYNRKYWKPPIIYAAFAGCGYLFYTNQKDFKQYRIYLKAENDDDPNTVNTSGYSSSQLSALKNDSRKYRDLGAIGCIAVYALNIIDANIDAHLKTFDVSDNLSMKMKPFNPFFINGNNVCFAQGISIQLNFK